MLPANKGSPTSLIILLKGSAETKDMDNGSVQCTFDKVGIFKVRIRTGFAAGGNDSTQQLVTVLSRGNLN